MGLTARPYNAEPPCTDLVQGGFLFLSRAGSRVRPLTHTHIRAAAGAYAHSRTAAGQLVEQAIHVGI